MTPTEIAKVKAIARQVFSDETASLTGQVRTLAAVNQKLKAKIAELSGRLKVFESAVSTQKKSA